MSEFITQTALAKHFGLAKSYITKLAKKGILDGCKNSDGKLVKECAIHAVERYRAGGKNHIREHVPPVVLDTPVFNAENVSDLDALLAQVDDPNRSVQLMKDFWTAKLNEYKAKEQKKELIRLDEVVEANQKIIKAFRDKALSVPTKLTPVLESAKNASEIKEILEDAMYELLTEVSTLDNILD